MNNEGIIHLLFGYDGRIARGRFWLGILLLMVSTMLVFLLAEAMIVQAFSLAEAMKIPRDVMAVVGFALIFLLATVYIYAHFALYSKRCHDLGFSGWFSLLTIVPIIGIGVFIYIAFFPGETGPNMYGPDPFGAVPPWSGAVFE